MHLYHLGRRGFSIAQVLIAFGLISLLIVGFSQSMVNTMKGIKTVDLKGQSQSIETLVRFSTINSDVAKKTFDIAGGAIKIPAAEFPKLTGLPDKATIYLTKLELGGKPYVPATTTSAPPAPGAKGTVFGELEFIAGRIVLGRPISASKDKEFLARLELDFKRVNQNTAYGTGDYPQAHSVYLKFKENGGSMDLDDAWGQTSYDSKALCDDLGGYFLDGTYMPKPRCSMAKEMVLNINELPEKLESIKLGGRTVEGERAAQCFYTGGTTEVKTYNCKATVNGKAGDRCIFRTTQAPFQWQVQYFNAAGVAGAFRFVCDRGVAINAGSNTSMFLDYNEPIDVAYGRDPATNPFTATQRNELLGAVSRCSISIGQESWSNCINTQNYDAALEGKANACIYVQGVNSIGGDAEIRIWCQRENPGASAAALTQCVTDFKQDYTGWAIVHPSYPRVIAVSTISGVKRQTIREARPLTPCFQVELNTSGQTLDATVRSAFTVDPPNQALYQNPARVKTCGYRAKALEKAGTAFYNPPAMSAPDNRVVEFRCHNDNVNTESPKTLVGGFDYNEIGGDASELLKFPPSLTERTCWYVKGVNLTSLTSAAATATEALGSATDPNNVIPYDKKYTGWVYLKPAAPLPPQQYKVVHPDVGYYLESRAAKGKFTEIFINGTPTGINSNDGIDLKDLASIFNHTDPGTIITPQIKKYGINFTKSVDFPTYGNPGFYGPGPLPTNYPDYNLGGKAWSIEPQGGKNNPTLDPPGPLRVLNAIPCNAGVRLAE